MKKFYIFLLPVLFLSLTSCSKEDDNNDQESSDLAGEWQMEAFQYQGTTTVKQGESFDQSSFTGTAKDMDAKIVFIASPDNTWESSGSYSLELVTIVNGETYTSEENYSNISEGGAYSLDGRTLSIGYNEQEGALAITECTIAKLTESELVLEFQMAETSEVSGYEVELLIEGTQSFSR